MCVPSNFQSIYLTRVGGPADSGRAATQKHRLLLISLKVFQSRHQREFSGQG
jgi:hypothetical protein